MQNELAETADASGAPVEENKMKPHVICHMLTSVDGRIDSDSLDAVMSAEAYETVAAKRPVADVFIKAFASRFQGLITRNPKHFTMVNTLVP